MDKLVDRSRSAESIDVRDLFLIDRPRGVTFELDRSSRATTPLSTHCSMIKNRESLDCVV